MNRKDLFEYIITHNLKEDVKSTFGKQYNMVSTDELNKYVQAKMKVNEHKVIKPIDATLDRKTCYELIVKNKWNAHIKAKFGKSYSSVSTENLIKSIKECMSNAKKKTEEVKNVVTETPKSINKGCIDEGARKVLTSLCVSLNRKDLLEYLK